MTFEHVAIVLCGLVVSLHAYGSSRVFIARRSGTASGRQPRLPDLGRQHFVSQLALFLMIIGLLIYGSPDPEILGIVPATSPVVAFAAGSAAYIALLVTLEVVSALFGVRERLHDVAFEALRFVWPRERAGKPLAVVAVCVLNPVTEEVIYRGVMIGMLGSVIDDFAVAAALGLFVSLVAHIYQGALAIAAQFCFHVCAIALFFSPFGLVACIGFHFAGDVVPVVTMRSAMRGWAGRRRAEFSRRS